MQDFWDVNQIRQILPKDHPFLFIDRVVEVNQQAKRIKCLKNITANEYFFSTHFPVKPVIPGAVIIEAAHQASIILWAILNQGKDRTFTYCLERVEATFFNKVMAGDQLSLGAEADKISETEAKVKVVASVGDKKCAQTTVFLKVSKGGRDV